MKKLAACAAGLCLLAFATSPTSAAQANGGWGQYLTSKPSFDLSALGAGKDFPELWLLEQRSRFSAEGAKPLACPERVVDREASLKVQRG